MAWMTKSLSFSFEKLVKKAKELRKTGNLQPYEAPPTVVMRDPKNSRHSFDWPSKYTCLIVPNVIVMLLYQFN